MTPTCDRRQSTDLAHAATCPSCGDALRALGRIEHALATIHDDRRPPPGWKTRMLAAIPAPTTRRVSAWTWTWRRLALALTPLAAIAVVAALRLAAPTAPVEPALTLDVAVEAQPGFRGSNGPGVLTARGAGGPPLRTLTLYRGATVVHRCPSDTGCLVRAGTVTLHAPAAVVGRYTLLYVASDLALAPSGTLDADLAAAIAAGAEVVVKTVDVQ